MEDYETMGISDKRKYFQAVIRRYHRSGKEKRRRILDEFCAVFEQPPLWYAPTFPFLSAPRGQAVRPRSDLQKNLGASGNFYQRGVGAYQRIGFVLVKVGVKYYERRDYIFSGSVTGRSRDA
jgi:hypothetical protein